MSSTTPLKPPPKYNGTEWSLLSIAPLKYTSGSASTAPNERRPPICCCPKRMNMWSFAISVPVKLATQSSFAKSSLSNFISVNESEPCFDTSNANCLSV